MHPPDPEMRRGAVGSGTPRVAKSSGKQNQDGLISAETQAAFFALLPIVLLVGLLAAIGGQP
jgi:hypothetical protein